MKCPICDEETGMEIGGKPFCVFCESQSRHAQHLCCDCGKELSYDLQGNSNPTSCHECADSYAGAAYRELDAVRSSVNYSEPTDTLQGCRESDRTAEGLDTMGKPMHCNECGEIHDYKTACKECEDCHKPLYHCICGDSEDESGTDDTEIETIDIAHAVKHIDRTTALVADLATEMIDTHARNEQYPSEKLDVLKDAIKARKDAQENLLKSVSGR